HIFLGVRDPDPDCLERGERARAAVDALCGRSELAQVYHLGSMRLDDAESRRMLASIREEVPVAENCSDEVLLQYVAGFAGVLGRWRAPAEEIADTVALGRLSDKAKAYVYGEFNPVLMQSLSRDEMRFALRLVLFPELDPDDWHRFKPVLVDELPE